MRIGINTLFENPKTGTGGLTYIRNLILALAKIDHQNEYSIFVSPLNRELFPIESPNFSFVFCPYSKERRLGTIVFEHTRFPSLIRKHRIDVWHSPGNIAPIYVPCASVVTIHSMHHYVLPAMMAQSSRIYRRALLPATTRRADAIIAISDWVRNFLVERLRVSPDKILRIYEGVELPNTTAVPERLNSPAGPFILFVSALWPYKNAHNLIQAFSVLKKIHGIPHNLLIVGQGWTSYRHELECLAKRLGLTETVRFEGRVSNVFDYYRSADVLVYPSLHEEFGLPLLEAMACGTPVVASDRGSLPEVAGDAALLTDPEDPQAIAHGIKRMLSDANLRQELVRKGKLRAARFTWERTAKETLEAYGQGYDRRHMRTRMPESDGNQNPINVEQVSARMLLIHNGIADSNIFVSGHSSDIQTCWDTAFCSE